MKIKEAENLLVEKISFVYSEDEAKNIARLLIEHLTGLKPEQISQQRKEDHVLLSSEILEPFLQRILQHEPVQYIMNKAWFFGLELYIDPAVLIPRPETEELVDWVIRDVKATGLPVFTDTVMKADKTDRLKIIDVCTGSGCIALALKKFMPLAEVWGCDISEEALNVARRNGALSDIRVDFQGMDFLDSSQQKLLPSVDIIVCNPPYIPEKDTAEMKPNVLDFEPHQALFVPNEDPFIFYRAIIQYSTERLHPGGRIYMEVHEDLAGEVKNLFDANGFQTEIKKDMQGKERMIRVRM